LRLGCPKEEGNEDIAAYATDTAAQVAAGRISVLIKTGESRAAFWVRVVVSVMVMALLGATGARAVRADESAAADPPKRVHKHRAVVTTTTTTTTAVAGPSVENRLDGLTADVTNLKASSVETGNEVKKIEAAINVAPPAKADTPPATIGEHVAVLETGLSDVRKNLSDNLGVHIHGLVDAGYEYNLNEPNTTGIFGFASNTAPTNPGVKGNGVTSPGIGVPGRENQYRAFDVDANSFELNQGNIHIDRTVDQGVGFVMDLNFGRTAELLQQGTRYSSSGPLNTATSNGDVDPTQFYLTWTAPIGSGLNLSAGKYVTLLGAEVIPVYNNLNYEESRSFLFTLGEPLTHTGVRAQYTFNSKIGATVGLNNGWDNASDNNSGKTMEAQFAFTPTDSLSLLVNGMYGAEQSNQGGPKRGIIDPILTWKTPITGLTTIGEYLYGNESSGVSQFVGYSAHGNSLAFASAQQVAAATGTPVGPPIYGPVVITKTSEWNGFAGYLVYDLTDKLELATRGEFFRDGEGARTGMRQTLGEVTFTTSYKVAPGLLARAEYRHDESNADPFFGNAPVAGAGAPYPFQTGLPTTTYAGQDTFSGSAIYAF